MRTCQAAFIYFDADMYYKPADQAALSRSWNLSDDLGQVKFIVSDKTGTLTQVCVSSVRKHLRLPDFGLEFHDFQEMFYWRKDLRRR